MPALVVDVRLTLPDGWWIIPLADEEGRHRSIAALVARQFTGIEDRPLIQSGLRTTLRAQAEAANQAQGSRLLAISLAQPEGVPMPASLVLSWLDLPGPAERGRVLMDLQERLHPDLTKPLPAGCSLDLARVPPGHVLRRVHLQRHESAGSAPIPSLVADYWLERPDGGGVVHLAFGTPLVPIREQMLELFDAIVSALRWVTAPVG